MQAPLASARRCHAAPSASPQKRSQLTSRCRPRAPAQDATTCHALRSHAGSCREPPRCSACWRSRAHAGCPTVRPDWLRPACRARARPRLRPGRVTCAQRRDRRVQVRSRAVASTNASQPWRYASATSCASSSGGNPRSWLGVLAGAAPEQPFEAFASPSRPGSSLSTSFQSTRSYSNSTPLPRSQCPIATKSPRGAALTRCCRLHGSGMPPERGTLFSRLLSARRADVCARSLLEPPGQPTRWVPNGTQEQP